jgi:hypothetical protein
LSCIRTVSLESIPIPDIDKWKSWKLKKFTSYFLKQWVLSPFKNWQLYSTPIGYATTNNPIEQYNAIIKKFFTQRMKLNIISMLKIFTECIQYESSKIVNYKFCTQKLVDTHLINEANKLQGKKIYKTLNYEEEVFNYRHTNGRISPINVVNKNVHALNGLTKAFVRI